jgi:hypothetical protein
VFEETLTETEHLCSHGEKLQAATEIAGALLPSAPELAVAEKQGEPQSHTIKPEPNKSPSEGAEHDVQHTYTLRALSPLTPLNYVELTPCTTVSSSEQPEWCDGLI